MPIRNPDPGEGYLPDDPGGIERPEGPTQSGPPTYNTTPMWQDPYHPPSPGDPYWDEWIAVNPSYVPPPTAPTGQTDPGAAPPPAPAPAPTGPSPFDYTLPGAPSFAPPEYTPPPAFSYENFVAPTAETVLTDPGYQFRLKQGEQGLMNNRAARGILNTGGTLKDFLGYNQNFATQEYGNVWDRAADAYRTNRGNALDTYNTNYKTQFADPYDLSYKGALDKFAPTMEDWRTRVQDAQHQADERRRYAWMIGNA